MHNNNKNAQYETLRACQSKYIKENDTHNDSLSLPIGFKVAVAIQHEDGGLWTQGVMKRLITVITMEDPTLSEW